METKFTDSNWVLGIPTDNAPYCVDAFDPKDGQRFEVCSVWGINEESEDSEEALANAYLIAASRKMYKALLAISKGEGLTPGETIESILAEARGEKP